MVEDEDENVHKKVKFTQKHLIPKGAGSREILVICISRQYHPMTYTILEWLSSSGPVVYELDWSERWPLDDASAFHQSRRGILSHTFSEMLPET
jgi:hypothetical protein